MSPLPVQDRALELDDNRPMVREGRDRGRLAPIAAGALALAVGCAIAWVDTRPNWDDTGVTAGVLFLAGGLSAALGLRWWLAILLVAGPMVLVEHRSAGAGIVLAPLITTAGALCGRASLRLFRSHLAE